MISHVLFVTACHALDPVNVNISEYFNMNKSESWLGPLIIWDKIYQIHSQDRWITMIFVCLSVTRAKWRTYVCQWEPGLYDCWPIAGLQTNTNITTLIWHTNNVECWHLRFQLRLSLCASKLYDLWLLHNQLPAKICTV